MEKENKEVVIEHKEEEKNGFKTITYNNGNVYNGEVLNNLRNGIGELKYANGDIYEGYKIFNT